MTQRENPFFKESKNHIHNTNNISKEELVSFFKKTIEEDAKNIFNEKKDDLIASIQLTSKKIVEEEVSKIFNYNSYPEIDDVFRDLSAKKDFSDFVQGAVRAEFLKELKKRTSFDLSIKQPLFHDISIENSKLD